jgi:NADH dehydrogenase FAD-containing subunit
VTFRLGQTVRAVNRTAVMLEDGTTLPADIVVVGVGVRPALALAEGAGLAVDNGVLVDEYLETSSPGVFAAGDIARWPDPLSGQRLRVEHWVVAERQGQVAAHNLLGERVRYTDVPFFWTWHHDVAVNYVGHHGPSARIGISGSLQARDALVAYRESGRITAVATIARDRESLRAEVALERNDAAQLAALADQPAQSAPGR